MLPFWGEIKMMDIHIRSRKKFLQQIVPSCKLKIYTVLKQELKEPKRVSGL